MLTDELKSEIQGAYSRLLEARGFRARRCQKLMIAEIARTLGDIESDDEGHRLPGANTTVVEAGTGTGKTIAYVLAALPIARALGKKLVLSTATVALQEQIMYLDLPAIRSHANLDVTFALAKGRRRYLCLSRLDAALNSAVSSGDSLSLFDEEYPEDLDLALYQEMIDRLGKGDWNGDRDDWHEEIPARSWAPVSIDHTRCTHRQCSHYSNCVFFRAREQIHRVDIIVTNHDLVLADLMMGGGAVLPAPEDAIYVFDEGHHLPDKAISHFSGFFQLRATQRWLGQIQPSLGMLRASTGLLNDTVSDAIQASVADLAGDLESVLPLISQAEEAAVPADGRNTYRYPRGIVPVSLRDHARTLAGDFSKLGRLLTELEDRLKEALEEAAPTEKDGIEQWLPVVSGMAARVESAVNLWCRYRDEDAADLAPHARWLVLSSADTVAGEEAEIALHASPISVSHTLDDLLWSRSFGVVITSATLSVGGDFARFRGRSGIGPQNPCTSLPSPFNFREQGVLRVPAMASDPGSADEHTAEIAGMLPALVQHDRASLVLFTSWRQMLGVMARLDDGFSSRVLRQGILSRSEIVRTHKDQVDAGHPSCIFGLASFAEGIDLPGDYCDHVVICKIPFAVPDDPVGATLAEWIESRGGNAFSEVMIPDAALRMVQACGRLLRTETDHGTITILDRRLVTRRYGQTLLGALPAFRREID
ncbi:MAG: ATP-dependent DNA helicase DinG [Proteobacteria bacterium]|jgi:ATP-dependent DNA helicase DinG|nr:ATP-dependent DNA helicase DinG [Pseudomonadota bacterium]MDA1301041.1 ATP-dependent DNA helicase DinG [Pseudomonadota bacterium]